MTLVYLDDIICRNYVIQVEHCARLTQLLNALCKTNLRLKLDKCYFGYAEVTYLGHAVNEEGGRISQASSQ